MSTFIYSPGIQVLIDTLGNGIIDISEDIMNGSVTLQENSPSSLNITFLNHRRKYDGMFTPNDIVVVRLKRLNWMPIFTGYLNEVPYFSTYPKAVKLTATCTLKRLKMQVWDEGSVDSVNLLSMASRNPIDQVDGGLRDKIMAIMEQVSGWPRYQIHIGQIPADWAERLAPLRGKLAEQLNMDPSLVGMSGVANGTNATTQGTQQIEGNGPGTGILPATRGRTGVISTNQPFELTDPERSGPGRVGSANGPVDEWFVQMRWPYREDTAFTPLSSEEFLASAVMSQAKRWWKNRKILVVNPTNNRAVVLRAVDWGPSPTTGNVAAISSAAMTSLGGKAVKGQNGPSLEYRFASDTAQIGPQPEQKVEFNPSFGGNTQVAQPQYISAEDGQVWTGKDNLKPHTAAAQRFIKANWNTGYGIGGFRISNIAGTSKPSDHSFGQALDITISKPGSKAVGVELARGNAIAQWLVANPNVFGTKYVIWMDRINNLGRGWKKYTSPGGNTLQHRDHVHVSFLDGVRTEAGAMGSPWIGSTDADFGNYVLKGSGASVNQSQPSGSNLTGLVAPDSRALLNAFDWTPQVNFESEALVGARALLNDTPILRSIDTLTKASMRSFMSAPNGDFIAWFPDYFGHYGMASKMIVRDIELTGQGFTVAWDDSNLVTHQFVAGAMNGYSTGSTPGGPVEWENRINTTGVATVEFTELMEALFNVGADSSSERKKFFVNAEAILQRFGARVNYQAMPVITGPEAEFWYAVHLFQKSWASQFSSSIDLTFMPEVYPGMLLSLESFKFQAYVEQVTHSWNMSEAGGFSTTVRVIAPSTTDRSGFYGLPLAGEVAKAPVPVTLAGGSGGGRLEFL